MTAIQAYEALLVELNKVKAPHLSVRDFVYMINKSIQQYVNLVYNQYEITQQKVDDLRVLRGSVKLTLTRPTSLDNKFLYDGVWETVLPDDYLHILNCVVAFAKNNAASSCDPTKSHMFVGAKRLTSDSNPLVITNYYLRPSSRNPYYYINNVNSDKDSTILSPSSLSLIDGNSNSLIISTDTWNTSSLKILATKGTEVKIIDLTAMPVLSQSILPLYRKFLKIKNQTDQDIKDPIFRNLKIDLIDDTLFEISLLGYTLSGTNPTDFTSGDGTNYIIDKESQVRYGNPTRARMEIRCGEDPKYTPSYVSVDYIKAPLRVSLDEDLLDDIEDNSQILEFPDYVIYEIINQMVKLILENTGDTNRLQTEPAVNTTIGASAQSK